MLQPPPWAPNRSGGFSLPLLSCQDVGSRVSGWRGAAGTATPASNHFPAVPPPSDTSVLTLLGQLRRSPRTSAHRLLHLQHSCPQCAQAEPVATGSRCGHCLCLCPSPGICGLLCPRGRFGALRPTNPLPLPPSSACPEGHRPGIPLPAQVMVPGRYGPCWLARGVPFCCRLPTSTHQRLQLFLPFPVLVLI